MVCDEKKKLDFLHKNSKTLCIFAIVGWSYSLLRVNGDARRGGSSPPLIGLTKSPFHQKIYAKLFYVSI